MSITGTYDTNNIFAKIINGEMPYVTVFEDEHTLAFMDVFPQSRGHVLVIPKNEQARNLLDASHATLGQVMATVQKISRAVNTALKPEGIVITQFNGAPAGQTVFHLHVHILPRYENTNIATHASGQMADMDELTDIARQIKSAL